MAATYNSSGFKFEDGQEEPDHINEYPRAEDRDKAKIWLEGQDTFDWELYPVAINIDDLPTAEMLRVARLAHLEETQPSASSGGQGGIQDKVFIRQPAI